MANADTNSAVHFSTDNTNGYTPEQLARANAIMADCEYTEESEGVDADAYKAACEVALKAVEDDGDLTIETEAGVPSPTDTGVDGGLDVDVTVHIGGVTVTGGVTLIRRDSDGEWSSWGSRDHWCSQEILDVVDAHLTLPVLDDVLAAAQFAIAEDSDIEERLGE